MMLKIAAALVASALLFATAARNQSNVDKPSGITQEQLADKTGLTVESISNMERGLFGPKFENLEKIAAVLKVPVKELFDY